MRKPGPFVAILVLVLVFVPVAAESSATPGPHQLVDLGRSLFHDPALSANGRVSCATCHPLGQGGTTPEPQSRRGVDGKPAPFNTPSIWSSALSQRLGWRGDARDLAEVLDRAFTKPFVMGNADVAAVAARLAGDPTYARRFAQAGLRPDREGIAAALGQYLAYVTPRDAPGLHYLRGDKTAIDETARRGAELFSSLGCTSCHSGPNVGGDVMARFGSVVGDPYAERGQCSDESFCRSDADCQISGGGICAPSGVVRGADKGAGVTSDSDPPTYVFRAPSLLCVGDTAPYFHDGSARTLPEAVDVMARYQLGRTLTGEETTEIVAFLRTLSGVMPPGER